MAKTRSNKEGSIHAYTELKKSNKRKKNWIAGLSVVTILSLVSTTGLVVYGSTNVKADTTVKDNSKLEELEKSNKELSEIIKKMEGNKTELEAKISSLEKEKTKLSGEIGKLQETINTKEVEVGTLNKRVQTLDSQISTLKSEKTTLENRIVELENSDTSSKEEIASLNEQLAQKNNEIATKEISIQELTAKKTELEQNIQSLNEDIKTKNNRILELGALVTELSSGRYTLKVRNPEVTMTRFEFNNMQREGWNDITSTTGDGSPVEYRTVEVRDHFHATDEEKEVVNYYYFNGTSENGAYAQRTVNIMKESVTLKIKGVNSKDYDFTLEGNNVINYADLEVTSLAESYPEVSEISDIRFSNDRGGESMSLLPDGNVTLQPGTKYRVTFRVRLSGGGHTGTSYEEFMINTNTTGVGRIPQGRDVVINTSGLNEQGDFVIDFSGNDKLNMKLTLKKDGLESFYLTNETWGLQQNIKAVTSEGSVLTSHGGGYGSDHIFNMIITTDELSQEEINLGLDMDFIMRKYSAWRTTHQTAEFEVKSIEYHDNKAQFKDTPKVTDYGQVGTKAVIIFDGFGYKGVNVSMDMEGNNFGQVSFPVYDVSATATIVSSSENEAIIGINFNQGDANIYITIAPKV